MISPSSCSQRSPDRGGPREASRAVSPISEACPPGVRGPPASIDTAGAETARSTSGGTVADGLSARLATPGQLSQSPPPCGQRQRCRRQRKLFHRNGCCRRGVSRLASSFRMLATAAFGGTCRRHGHRASLARGHYPLVLKKLFLCQRPGCYEQLVLPKRGAGGKVKGQVSPAVLGN